MRQSYFERAEQVNAFLAAGDKAAAYDYIDRLAAKEAIRLASLVIGGE